MKLTQESWKEWAAKFSARAENGGKGRGSITFKNISGNSGPTEIYIYGEIGDSFWDDSTVSASDFQATLSGIPMDREILVRINSPGGNVWDGLAIRAQLSARKEHVVCRVDGGAASIASVIALAGRSCEMPAASIMMIHTASAVCMGTADDMRAIAEALDVHTEAIAGVYERKTGKDSKTIMAAMKAETWFTGATAKEYGLCDVMLEDDPDAEPDDSATNLGRGRVPMARATKPNPQAPVASGATKKSMKDKITALLTERGVQFEATATEDQLLALLEANPKPKATAATLASAIANAADAPKALTLTDISAEIARVNAVTARVNACAKDLKIPAASVATATARALKDESYLAEIEAYTPRAVGADPIANGQAGDAPKVITKEAYNALKPHEARAFFKAGGKLKD